MSEHEEDTRYRGMSWTLLYQRHLECVEPATSELRRRLAEQLLERYPVHYSALESLVDEALTDPVDQKIRRCFRWELVPYLDDPQQDHQSILDTLFGALRATSRDRQLDRYERFERPITSTALENLALSTEDVDDEPALLPDTIPLAFHPDRVWILVCFNMELDDPYPRQLREASKALKGADDPVGARQALHDLRGIGRKLRDRDYPREHRALTIAIDQLIWGVSNGQVPARWHAHPVLSPDGRDGSTRASGLVAFWILAHAFLAARILAQVERKERLPGRPPSPQFCPPEAQKLLSDWGYPKGLREKMYNSERARYEELCTIDQRFYELLFRGEEGIPPHKHLTRKY